MDLLLGDILYEGSSQSSDDDSANESFNVDEMVDRDFEGIHENNMPDPFKHLSSLYFSFDRKAYGLMVRDLKGEISVSLEMLKACDVRRMLDLKKWRRMKDTFGLAGVDNGSTCILQQTQPKLQIACIEDWGNIVKAAHCVRGASKHKSLNDTIEMLRSTWSIDVKRHGIPISYVKNFVNSCRCSFSSSNHTIDLNKLPMTTLITTEEGVAVELENIMIEHKTRIVMARSSKKESATKHIIHYVCHRGGTVQHCSKEKRSRTSKKCGCPFKVRLEYVNHRDEVRILINPNHEGHMPGSRANFYHLPVHPTVVESCLNDLFDVGSSRHVAQMSLSKERLLFERAPLLHRVIYRFFMIPKEVQMLSYKTRTADQIHDDDWATMYMEAKVLQNQGKVLYCQPYNPTASDPKDRPFILILQDEWMLGMGIRFSANNAWAIDSTLKTNKYGLPLFAPVLPNQLGVGISIWFMLCTCDVGARHEVIALEITIKRIFSRMANVRPSALVIDKSQQELDALLRVVNEDPHCWEYTFNGTRRQIACHVLLCWFHTKKAWVEHLLPQVPKEMRKDVYSTMCNIMHSVTEEEFEDRFQLLRQRYSSYGNIVRYVTNGWCGRDCMWRVCWPQFGRLFLHGNVDTTNLVERLWQYVKYTLLEARINRSLLELIHALVGNSKTGGRMGGTLLRFFKQKQEIADSGRYGVPGNSKEHRARLLAGERILQRFEEIQDTLQVLNAMQLQFRILSMTTPNQWYQVNFQSNYCDCPNWSSECKHLYGVKLIVKHHFPEMATILPVLDNAHQTLATYDNEMVTEEKEEKVKTCIHELKELLLSLEQEIPNKSPKDMEIMLHQLRLSKDMLGALLSPSQINMPACGSVRQIQAHVTRTRLGHGVPKDVGAPPLEAAPKPIPHTGSLKRKHQHGRSRVQFAKWPRIWCPHCCSKTLLVDPKEVVACQTCHALLPLSLRHCHPGDEMLLLGKEIMAFLESGSWHARIDSCAYAHGTNDEQSFKIKPSYENTMQIVFASKLRMVLVY
ncbi:hypothetical protein L7F22_011226 [Adiantum nelumboides]|nr:hypothetical protein [Adiantum nelumboides]